MADTVEISLTVNGERVDARVSARLNLVDFVRHQLGLTGSHVGCEHGVCGACTILVDGDIVRGCLMLAAQTDGTKVTTIEGVAEAGAAADLQQAFVARNALQCGYCTPGMMLTALSYLDAGGPADRPAIRDYMSGNYCRCTGYHAIVDAVEEVAQARAGTRVGKTP